MLKVSIAVLTATLFAAALTISGASSAFADSHTSTDDSKLSCTLDISVVNGKVTVTWTITGATKASIDPLTFKGGKVPLKGSQTVDAGGALHVFLVAEDAAGHTVRCTADEGRVPAPGNSAGGYGGANEPD